MKNKTVDLLMPGEIVQVPAVTSSLCYAFPLRQDYLAQLVLPRDLTEQEALRLGNFIETLIAPPAHSAGVSGE